jgi:hypothetical protein
MRAAWGRSELHWEGARGPQEASGGERRRGGRAVGEILLGLPLFEIVFLEIF